MLEYLYSYICHQNSTSQDARQLRQRAAVIGVLIHMSIYYLCIYHMYMSKYKTYNYEWT